MTKLLGWLRYCKFMTCNVETKFASACQGQRPNAKGLEILNIELQYTVIVNTCGKHCASSKLACFHSVLHKLRCNTHIIEYKTNAYPTQHWYTNSPDWASLADFSCTGIQITNFVHLGFHIFNRRLGLVYRLFNSSRNSLFSSTKLWSNSTYWFDSETAMIFI